MLLSRLLACLCGALALASAVAHARPPIRVEQEGWGAASAGDIEAVLASVAEVLAPDFPEHANSRIVVRFSLAGPRVLEERTPGGAYQVLLSVRDARWDQFAYQFSHELCHIVSNFDRRPLGPAASARAHQWFEETLCEAVSVVALERLAARWRDAAPHRGWEAYAGAFRDYAERLRAQSHRSLLRPAALGEWYRRNARALEADPYLREKNESAAAVVLEWLEGTPDSLQALAYLNLAAHASGSFAEYLAAWHECCPERHRAALRRLIALFSA